MEQHTTLRKGSFCIGLYFTFWTIERDKQYIYITHICFYQLSVRLASLFPSFYLRKRNSAKLVLVCVQIESLISIAAIPREKDKRYLRFSFYLVGSFLMEKY